MKLKSSLIFHRHLTLCRTIVVLLLSVICTSGLSAQNFENILWTVDAGPEYTAIGGNYDTLYLWSHQIPKTDVKLPIPGCTITNVKWHPNGHLLTISTQVHQVDGGVMVLDMKTMTTHKLEGIPSTGARAIGWNPAGELLAIGDNEGDLHIFDKSYSLVKKVDTGLRSITSLDWHPQKNLITMVSGMIGQYNLDNEQMHTWQSRKEEMLMLSIAWHPSGAFFATGDYGDYSKKLPALLQFWKQDGSLIRSVEGSKAEYRNIRWTPDGTHLATASDAFRLWDISGNLITALPFDHLLWGLSFDKRQGQWMATDNTGQVFLISKDGSQRVNRITPFHRRQ